MLTTRLYFYQRLSAMLMAPMVLVHLATMIYAIQGGLDTSEILSRTQGSVFWGLFYAAFVVAAAVHAAIGLRVIAHEWLKITGASLQVVMFSIGIIILGLGGRAVFAVVF
jgi:fumarate reductase subunit C